MYDDAFMTDDLEEWKALAMRLWSARKLRKPTTGGPEKEDEMTTKRDECLLAAATIELGEDAGLGAVTKRAALYAMAPTLLAVLQRWHGTPHNLQKDCEICQVIVKAA